MDIRPTVKADIGAVDALLARSYPVLLKPDYPPSVLVTALPLISRAQPGLVTSGSYYGAFEGGDLLGAGGWTKGAPGGAAHGARIGHIRHLVCDPKHLRQGIARALIEHSFAQARSEGVTVMQCQATRTAVAFYGAMGFETLGDIDVPLRPGIVFPAVAMKRVL